MKGANSLGLPRDIPESVCREVRQRSGFGCVICGGAIIESHHFDSAFAEARSHSPEGISALCPSCHSKVTTGRISSSALLRAVEAPFSHQVGYSSDSLETGGFPTIILGGLTIISTPIILEVAGRTIIGFSPPESSGAPFRLNALFCNIKSRPIAEIIDNLWRAYLNSWNIETVGLRTIIRGGYRDIALIFRTEPPSRVIIERIHMFCKELRLEGREGSHLETFLPNGDLWFRALSTAAIIGCAKGIVLN